MFSGIDFSKLVSDCPSDVVPAGCKDFCVSGEDGIVKGFVDKNTGAIHIQEIQPSPQDGK